MIELDELMNEQMNKWTNEWITEWVNEWMNEKIFWIMSGWMIQVEDLVKVDWVYKRKNKWKQMNEFVNESMNESMNEQTNNWEVAKLNALFLTQTSYLHSGFQNAK